MQFAAQPGILGSITAKAAAPVYAGEHEWCPTSGMPACTQGDKADSKKVKENGYDERAGSKEFKFWVTDRQGKKLDYARSTALLFTLNLVFGGESDALMRTPNAQHAAM